MSLLREVSEFRRLLRRQRNQHKTVAIYAEHRGYYPYFEGIIKELCERHGISVYYITSESTDPILDRTETRLEAFYLKKLLPFFFFITKMRVMIMTMTDLNVFHLKRSLYQVHYVYVFHALVSTHRQYRERALDGYDSILCVGLHHKTEIRAREQMAGLPPKELIEAGYYRLERIYAEFQAFKAQSKEVKLTLTILIAPSWSKNNLLENVGKQLVEVLLSSGYHVIVRPHPQMQIHAQKLINSYRLKFGNNEKFTLEESIMSDESLLEADVLITDWSGIAFEYALGTERPVLFFNTPPKIHNSKYTALGIEPIEVTLRSQLGMAISPEDVNQTAEIIKGFLGRREDYRARLQALRSKVVYNFGHSSEVSAAYIASLLQ